MHLLVQVLSLEWLPQFFGSTGSCIFNFSGLSDSLSAKAEPVYPLPMHSPSLRMTPAHYRHCMFARLRSVNFAVPLL